MPELAWGAWYWTIIWGAAGASVAEVIRYLYNRETIPGHVSYGSYVIFATVCGGLLCLLVEPGSKVGAFALGVGWLTTLAKMVKIDPFSSVSEVMKMLGEGDFVRPSQTLEDVKRILDRTKATKVPVVNEENKLIGIITDGQYDRAIDAKCDPKTTKVEDFMNKAPIAVDKRAKPKEVEKTLMVSGLKSLVVTDHEGRPVGLVDREPVLRLKEMRKTLL